MVDATLSMLVAHQNSRYDEWGFSGSLRFDPGMAGRGLSLNLTPSFGAAAQGANRLWAMQDMGGPVPYGAVPSELGDQVTADVGYGMTRPGGRGTGTPYAGLTQSGIGHRAMHYGWRWEIDPRFNIGVEGARQGGRRRDRRGRRPRRTGPRGSRQRGDPLATDASRGIILNSTRHATRREA